MSNSSNHYYELPFEMIENIESYLKIKPQEVEEIIKEPPNNYKNMLKLWRINYDNCYKYRYSAYTEKQKYDYNKKIEQMNIDLIKFFIKYDVIAVNNYQCKKSFKQCISYTTKRNSIIW